MLRLQRDLLGRYGIGGSNNDADQTLIIAGDTQGLDYRNRSDPSYRGDSIQMGDLAEQRIPIHRSPVRVLGEHARDEDVHGLGHLGSQAAQPRRLLEQNFRQHRRHMLREKRRSPGQTLKQDASERKNIRARTQVALAARLLGRHIFRRAQHRAGTRHIVRAGDAPGDAEVEYLYLVHPTVTQV